MVNLPDRHEQRANLTDCDDGRADITFDPRVDRWMEQARDARIASAIESIYRDAASTIEEQRPLCLASGHCCHFGSFGHDLFVTALEAAWFLATLEESSGSGASLPLEQPSSLPVISSLRTRVTAAAERVCPWLDGRLCGARSARPLGCRTFFCDPRAARWSEPLHERLHGQIRSVHQDFDVTYHYDEWLRMLRLFGADGREARRP